VISKLERLMEEIVKNQQMAKEGAEELEKIKKEVADL
jgi:hypothetical protein